MLGRCTGFKPELLANFIAIGSKAEVGKTRESLGEQACM